MTPERSHENWIQYKLKDGWRWGPVKNPDLKQHPCLVNYDELPPEQHMKDRLFLAIVKAFYGL